MYSVPLILPLSLLAVTWSCCTATKSVLILQQPFSASHERNMRLVGEHLVTQHGYRVTQVRWLTNMTSSEVPSSMKVISLRLNAVADLNPQLVDHQGILQVPLGEIWRLKSTPANLPRLGTLLFDIARAGQACCERLLSDRALLERLRQSRFDVALVDLISGECMLELAHQLGLPVVGFWGFRLSGHESISTSAVNLPSVIPAHISDLPPEMNFWQRCTNVAHTVFQLALLKSIYMFTDNIKGKYFPDSPSTEELMRNVRVVLLHANVYGTLPTLLPPNIQMIGCLQCRPARPLPEELQNFMDSSGDHGVVVFSMGMTIFHPDNVPKEFLQAFLEAFGMLKQKVLLRFSTSVALKTPPNVKLVDWLPQVDVLGHPRTRVFVSHCGVGSVMESLYFGVPILGVPVFMDQLENARLLEYRGLGLALDRFQLTAETVAAALHRLLEEPEFRQHAQRAARMQQLENSPPALHTAAHWIRLVAELGRLEHHEMVDRHLSWWQYWLLDVLLLYTLTLSLLLTACCRCCCCCRRPGTKHTANRPAPSADDVRHKTKLN